MLFELVYNVIYGMYRLVCYPIVAVLFVLMMISFIPCIIIMAATFVLIPEDVLDTFEKSVLSSDWIMKP